MEKRCLLSVVVPVYNVEKYLSTCLDSLLEQNIPKEEYEIICVNDGSTDGSLAILQEYAVKNDNIRCIQKENQGVSIARNVGLDNASGDYVWFVDADDWITRDSLGVIRQELITHRPSLMQVHFDWIQSQWRIDECVSVRLQSDKVKSSVHGVSLLPYVGAWNSIIQRSLLKRYGHRFVPHLHYGEDVLFIRELTDRMKMEEEKKKQHTVVHCCGEIFYYYRLHNESACRSSWTKHREKYMEALEKLAIINYERMNDISKPKWYRIQYEGLFHKRMHNYLMDWLPGVKRNWKEQKHYLKEKGLYPCPRPSKATRKMLTNTAGLVMKVKVLYKYYAFRWQWLYPVYFKQMKRRYRKEET